MSVLVGNEMRGTGKQPTIMTAFSSLVNIRYESIALTLINLCGEQNTLSFSIRHEISSLSACARKSSVSHKSSFIQEAPLKSINFYFVTKYGQIDEQNIFKCDSSQCK